MAEHDDLREQAGLYALGALSGAARAAFEAHLASCAECAAEVRALSAVSGALARAAPQTDPPLELRARVLEAITGGGPSASGVPSPAFGAGSGTVPAGGAEVGLPVPRSAEGPVPRSAEGPVPRSAEGKPDMAYMRPDTTYMAWLAAAASLVLAVALGAYSVQLRGRIGALEVRLREAMLRADANERQIADARRAAADADSKVAVLAAPDLARIDLAGEPVAPRASARAYWSRSRGLVFTASNLPALPPGRVYQLWVISAQPAPTSAGFLRPDANGRVDVMLPTPPDLPKPTAMAVTIEPEGGVPAPTGDRYLIGAAH